MAMELRHLRCFVVLAEELHFGRAAERLNIEQSPLSRTIKELEDKLGVLLFNRSRRGTLLSHAGKVFLHDARRILASLEDATTSARAAAFGSCGLLRIALSDGAIQPRLATLLALSREEDPGVEIRLTEVPLPEQVRGLHNGTFDAGFARTPNVCKGVIAIPIWREPLVAAVPSRHPLLAHSSIPMDDLLRYPIILPHPDVHSGTQQDIERLMRTSTLTPIVAELATSCEMMLTLVAAGFGVGICTAERAANCGHNNVVSRPLALAGAMSVTYILRKLASEPMDRLEAFLDRAKRSADEPPSETV